MNTAMIRIENLSKHYSKVRALNGLNLNVQPGVVYGFLGPNGAGKTTTLRILSGLARADGGQAWIMDQPVGLKALGKRPVMGVLPEEPAFYPWMTPREYLQDFIAPLYGLDARESGRRTAELLDTVGLERSAKRRIGGFSRGMRQRLGLAQAMIHRPSILLLDEPVSALDPAGRKDLLELIEGLRGQVTVLLSTHILADVERVCDMVGIIRKGKMVVEAERDALLATYALPIIEVEADDGFGEWTEQVRGMPFVVQLEIEGKLARARVNDIERGKQELLASIVQSGLSIRRFELSTSTLEDVFLDLTEEPQPEGARTGG
jgi:ABC-2 type transport system ATP-binding protein